MRRRLKPRTAILAVLLLSLAGQAQATGELSLDGYFKSYFVAYELPALSDPDGFGTQNQIDLDPPAVGAVSNRVRLNLRYRAADWLHFNVAYDFAPRVQDPALFAGEAFVVKYVLSGTYRADDLDAILYPSGDDPISSFAVYQNLDRLSATIRAKRFDLIIGRQSVAWGAARVTNPTDILTPFAYGQLDVEDRVGVDAVRLRVPLGFMGELDAGYVFGADWESSRAAAFGRLKFYAAETDISLIACRFREHLMLGGDLARSVGGAGTWLELAQVLVDIPEDGSNPDDYFRASVGADYSFSDGLYGFVEYHYNGAGVGNAADYLSLHNAPAYLDGSVYLLSQQYIIPCLSYQITPLLVVSGEALINLNDGSALVAPGVEYNVAENVYLQIGGYLAIGASPTVRESEIAPDRPEFALESEFGSYPHTIFSSFRIYF